jgi:hypothetical protein
MATPLNAFKTKTWSLRDSDASQGKLVYNSPPGVTAIVLMAQVANYDSDERTCRYSFIHKDTSTGIETQLVDQYPVRKNDAASPLTGKLIIQEGNQIYAYAHAINNRYENGGVGSVDCDDSLKLTLSLLESLNG